MPATLSRESAYSLWASSPPGEPGQWHHQDTGTDYDQLELKAKGLRRLFTNRRFVVVQGLEPPRQ